MILSNLLYQIIYQQRVNYALRNLNKGFNALFGTHSIKLPPSGIFSLKTQSGTIQIATNQTSHISQLLYWNGYSNFEYSTIMEKLAPKIGVFLDVGSNFGYYALLSAKANANLKVFAFEPAQGPGHYLGKNIKLNHFQNQIQHYNLALANQEGHLEFYEVKNKKYPYLKFNLSGEHNAGTKVRPDMFVRTRVQATGLDDFAKTANIEKIDLIKMDTEGTEIDILRSGKHAIEKHRPIVICEVLFNVIEAELEAFFKDLGYGFYQHKDGALIKVDRITRNVDDGIRNCFFVPPSKIGLIKEFVT